MKKGRDIVILIVLVTLCAILGWTARGAKDRADARSAVLVRENPDGQSLINPLLLTQTVEKSDEFEPLRQSFGEYIDEAISEGKTKRVSVYFREMNSGKYTGIAEDDLYSPASMLKVTTMIAYLKLSNQYPDIFSRKTSYRYHEDAGQHYKPSPLSNGSYSNLALMQQMIIHSDNSAMDLLDQKHIDDILKVYEDLGMPNPVGSDTNFLSPRQYSRLFRVLYNATYLSRSYSQQTLYLLTHVAFDKGLTAGTPDGVAVAHKFGEYSYTGPGRETLRQLHDCGIIYAPGNPYFLCVMTEGNDFDDLESVIAEISRIAYDSAGSPRD